MKIHFSPSASGMLRLIQKRGLASSGWVTGTVMGHTWIVDGLFYRPEAPGSQLMEWSHAVDACRGDLLGEFYAFRGVPEGAREEGGLLLRIDGDGIEAFEGDTGTKVTENG